MPIPASMPCTTAGEMARNQPPSLATPAKNWIAPAISSTGPNATMPYWRTSSNTMTARPAAGPLTCSGEPASAPTMMPPMMPVIRPFSGGTPEAIAMPMHNGIATRNTTIDAVKSRTKTF